MSAYRYPWPASAISPQDMALLHRVRETSAVRIPITELIARAVRQAYAEAHNPENAINPVPHLRVLQPQDKEAA